MTQHKDDTTERNESSVEEPESKPGSYYYDDSTGYKIYDPEKDDEDEGGDESLYEGPNRNHT